MCIRIKTMPPLLQRYDVNGSLASAEKWKKRLTIIRISIIIEAVIMEYSLLRNKYDKTKLLENKYDKARLLENEYDEAKLLEGCIKRTKGIMKTI